MAWPSLISANCLLAFRSPGITRRLYSTIPVRVLPRRKPPNAHPPKENEKITSQTIRQKLQELTKTQFQILLLQTSRTLLPLPLTFLWCGCGINYQPQVYHQQGVLMSFPILHHVVLSSQECRGTVYQATPCAF